jgi:hypothetical protein
MIDERGEMKEKSLFYHLSSLISGVFNARSSRMSRGTVATFSAEHAVRLVARQLWIRQRMFVFGDRMRDNFPLHLSLLPVPNRHRNELAQGVVNA